MENNFVPPGIPPVKQFQGLHLPLVFRAIPAIHRALPKPGATLRSGCSAHRRIARADTRFIPEASVPVVLIDLAFFCGKPALNRHWQAFRNRVHGGSTPDRFRFSFPFLFYLFYLSSCLMPNASCLLSLLTLVSSQFSRLAEWTGRICPTAQAGGAAALGSISLGCAPDSSCHRSPPWPAT